MNRTHILSSVIGALVLGLFGAGAVAHAASFGGLGARSNPDGAQLMLVRGGGGGGGGHGGGFGGGRGIGGGHGIGGGRGFGGGRGVGGGRGFGGGGYAYGNR